MVGETPAFFCAPGRKADILAAADFWMLPPHPAAVLAVVPTVKEVPVFFCPPDRAAFILALADFLAGRRILLPPSLPSSLPPLVAARLLSCPFFLIERLLMRKCWELLLT